MPLTEPRSAVVVRIPLPASLSRLRARWDPTAAAGVPPHVTILFPFLPSENLVPDVRRRLAAVATSVDPFEALFNRTGHFPGVIYLAPEPAAPFVRLTELVLSQFPDHPPYGGAFDEIVPHLTICDSEAAPLDALAEQAARSLPFGRPVAAIEVLIEGADDLWHPRWRLPLGKASRTDHKVRQ